MVALLRTGCGIGMLPSYVAAAEPELVPVSGPIEELAGTAWILTHPDLRRTARIQAFMRFVGDAVAQRIARASEEDRRRLIRLRGSGTREQNDVRSRSHGPCVAWIGAPPAG